MLIKKNVERVLYSPGFHLDPFGNVVGRHAHKVMILKPKKK